MSALSRTTHPAARKDHVCGGCGRRIKAKAERYMRWVGMVDDGIFDTLKLCAQCERLSEDLYDADVRGEDSWGTEVCPWLPEVDWDDVARRSPLWAERARLFRERWDGGSARYPEGGAA